MSHEHEWDEPANMAVTTYPPVVEMSPRARRLLVRIGLWSLFCGGILVGMLVAGCSEVRSTTCPPGQHLVQYKKEFQYGKPNGEVCR